MSIYDALPERRGISPVWQAEIAKDITNVNQLASVIIPDIDSDLRIEGAMWTPRPQDHAWSYSPPDTGWHIVGAAGEPPFLNGFSPWDARTPRFRKLSSGLVIVEGIMRCPAAATSNPAFYLPVGYRPYPSAYGDLAFVVNTTQSFGVCDIFDDGRVTFNPFVNSSWTYLSGVHFFAGPDLSLSDTDNVLLPTRGDPCLVIFDNDNRPWITVWWPYAN